jgi:hypothetical protein
MYSPEIAKGLRDKGYDVDCVKERPELKGLDDDVLLPIMIDERRALLTENVSDYAPLITRMAADEQSHYGIVYSSNSSMPRGKNTIGVFVQALAAIMDRFPGDDDFLDQVEWL